MKQLLVMVFAFLGTYLMLTMPMAYAVNVNLIVDGSTRATSTLDVEKIVNKQISIVHDPSDITWSNVVLGVKVEGASLLHQVKKIYVYNCKNAGPSDCLKVTPIVFDAPYADATLSWNFVSIPVGNPWPEVANILMLAKSQDTAGNVLWHGYYTTIERTNYNEFVTKESELNSVDLYLKSASFIQAAKNFIEKNQMIPFSWASKIVFSSASNLFVVRGSAEQFDQPEPDISPVTLPGSGIESIGDELTVVFPNTGMVNSPITLNKNPTFTCGNSIHEVELGETQELCCYDTGCNQGKYCDLAVGSPVDSGECKSLAGMSLTVAPVSAPEIKTCGAPVSLVLNVQINGPSSLESTLDGLVKLDGVPYPVTCTRKSSSYECPVEFTPTTTCGTGTNSLAGNEILVTARFNNGPNTLSRDLTASLADINMGYQCTCPTGKYCDAVQKECLAQALALGSPSVLNSRITDYNDAGDYIELKVSILNPPGGLSVQSMNYALGNISYGTGYYEGKTGTLSCTGGLNTNYLYTCSIPFAVSEYGTYNHETTYVISGGVVSFDVTYPDGSVTVQKTISSRFSDVTIPSYRCGDGVLHPEETSDACCIDAGCPFEGQYCDIVKGCRTEGDIAFTLDDISSLIFSDCDEAHTVSITLDIENMPSDAQVTTYRHNSDRGSFPLKCDQPNQYTGIMDCELTIPALSDCALPYKEITDNAIDMTLRYSDGSTTQLLNLNLEIPDTFRVIPTYTCGNGVCESDLLEGPGNCCRDCLCGQTGEYCDFDPTYDVNGTCREIGNIGLDVTHFTGTLKNCEIDNEVKIRAQIINPPAGLRVEHYYGQLNGTQIKDVRCEPETVFDVGNYTYDCTMIVPRQYVCENGHTYRYTDNALTFYITYNNGGANRLRRTIETELDDITVTQEFQTIYQILEHSKQRLEEKFNDMKDIISRALKYTKTCMELLKISLYATLAMIIVGAFAPTYSDASVLEGAAAGAQVGGILNQIINSYCNILNTYVGIELKLKDMEIKEIQMDTCIATYQHDLDSDRCRGQEINCFEQIKNCLNTMSSIQTDMKSIQNDFNNLGTQLDTTTDNVIKDIREVEDTLTGTTGKGNLYIECNSQASDYCCEFAGPDKRTITRTGDRVSYSGNMNDDCIKGTMKVEVRNLDNCKNPMIVIDDIFGTPRPGNINNFQIEKILGRVDGDQEQHVFKVYCDDDGDGVENNELLKGVVKTVIYERAYTLAEAQELASNDGIGDVSRYYCQCADISTTDNLRVIPGLTDQPAIVLFDEQPPATATTEDLKDDDGRVYAQLTVPADAQVCTLKWYIERSGLIGNNPARDELIGTTVVYPDHLKERHVITNQWQKFTTDKITARATFSCTIYKDDGTIGNSEMVSDNIYIDISGDQPVSQDDNSGTTTQNCEIVQSSASSNCGADGTCQVGEKVTLSAQLSGDCLAVDSLYIEAASDDGACEIKNQGGDIVGMTISTSPSGSTVSGDWIIDSIPSDCSNSVVRVKNACIYSGSQLVNCNSASYTGLFRFATSATDSCPANNCVDTALGWGAHDCSIFGGYYNVADTKLNCATGYVCCNDNRNKCEVDHTGSYGADSTLWYCRDSQDCSPAPGGFETNKCPGTTVCCVGK